MKKIILTAAAVLAFSFANAQEKKSEGGQTSKGKWLIEANTGFGSGHGANTGFSFRSAEGDNEWNIGAEGGYFIMDNLALKAGLGYGDSSYGDGMLSYKIGAKYYII